MKVGAIFLLALITPNLAKNFGSIWISGPNPFWNQKVYVVGSDWVQSHITMEDNGFTLHGGGKIYFASQPHDGFDSNMFWQANLDNKHFSYKIDVSNVGCHCNAAGYFVKMPGHKAGDGRDYYCDAQKANDMNCPEYDTFEGNKYTMAGKYL